MVQLRRATLRAEQQPTRSLPGSGKRARQFDGWHDPFTSHNRDGPDGES
jgi:hypothetical protein